MLLVFDSAADLRWIVISQLLIHTGYAVFSALTLIFTLCEKNDLLTLSACLLALCLYGLSVIHEVQNFIIEHVELDLVCMGLQYLLPKRYLVATEKNRLKLDCVKD